MNTIVRAQTEPAPLRKVLICKSVLLQYSETFILEQLHSYAHWDPILVGLRRLEVGASLVHTHFATEAVTFWPVVRRLGCPLVVTLHGSDINIYRESWER